MSAPLARMIWAPALRRIGRAAHRGKWAVAAMLLAGPAVAETFAVATRTDVAYGPLAEQRGDLFLPQAAPGLHPAAVLIHGGGWVEGQRAAFAPFARLLAERGVVALAIDYRLADPANPATRWPAQLVDAQLAVRWLRANAADYAIDPARIGAAGDSAGGTMAVHLGTLAEIVAGDQAALYPDQSPKVAAVVDQFGVMDLPGMAQGGAASITALFGTPQPPLAALMTVSPLGSITANSAPTLIVHGRSDALVPLAQSERLHHDLRAHGVATELVTFPGGHEYDGLTQTDLVALLDRQADWLAGALGARR